MKPEIINDLSSLERFNDNLKSFNKLLYCDCEGISLGKYKDSLTSVQLYEPISEVGYYIDIIKMRRKHKKRLVEVLQVLFEDKSFTFVFFDPYNDFKTMKELGVSISRIYCMKTMPLKTYNSLQNLVQRECSFKPWDIYEWIKEKYLSRLDFARNDYKRITKRPLTTAHANMALNDAYYMYLAHKRINPSLLPQPDWDGQIETFMNKLTTKKAPKMIRNFPKIKGDNHDAKKSIFSPKKVISMFQDKKLKWLACGYLYTQISSSKFRTIENQNRLRYTIKWCSDNSIFGHKIVSELQLAADKHLIPSKVKTPKVLANANKKLDVDK